MCAGGACCSLAHCKQHASNMCRREGIEFSKKKRKGPSLLVDMLKCSSELTALVEEFKQEVVFHSFFLSLFHEDFSLLCLSFKTKPDGRFF